MAWHGEEKGKEIGFLFPFSGVEGGFFFSQVRNKK
jgi:hypothetical protein